MRNHWFVRSDEMTSPDGTERVVILSRFGRVVCFHHIADDGNVRCVTEAEAMFIARRAGQEPLDVSDWTTNARTTITVSNAP